MVHVIEGPPNKSTSIVKKKYFESTNYILLNKLMIDLKANLINNKNTLFKINCIKKIRQNNFSAILINSNKLKRNLYFTNPCLNFFFFKKNEIEFLCNKSSIDFICLLKYNTSKPILLLLKKIKYLKKNINI